MHITPRSQKANTVLLNSRVDNRFTRPGLHRSFKQAFYIMRAISRFLEVALQLDGVKTPRLTNHAPELNSE